MSTIVFNQIQSQENQKLNGVFFICRLKPEVSLIVYGNLIFFVAVVVYYFFLQRKFLKNS